MDLVKFKQLVKESQKQRNYPVNMLIPLEELELLPVDKKIKRYAIDKRSYQKDVYGDGVLYWHVYPIAICKYSVYIVCPWCKEIHIHGVGIGENDYIGHRSPHCKDNSNNGYVLV